MALSKPSTTITGLQISKTIETWHVKLLFKGVFIINVEFEGFFSQLTGPRVSAILYFIP